MSWEDGYVTDIEYNANYFRQLSPVHLEFACLASGHVPSSPAPFNYLELGFGQGLSTNIHSVATDGEFWGVDFNPSHVLNARRFAKGTGRSVHLTDDSFAEFGKRDDLPEFDIIVMHGVLSWISPQNRVAIIDLVRRKLKIGGLVYVSYNCQPGWSSIAPLRELMKLQQPDGVGMNSAARAESAMKFIKELSELGAAYFSSSALIKSRMDMFAKQTPSYIAHEFLNKDWQVFYFHEVAAEFNRAKLTFVGSADLSRESRVLQENFQKYLAGIRNLELRETIEDFLVNRQFRRDLFMKGVQPIRLEERLSLIAPRSFVLIKCRNEVGDEVKIGHRSIPLAQNEQVRAVIDFLSQDDYRPKTFTELLGSCKVASSDALLMTLIRLIAADIAAPAQSPSADVRSRCANLNKELLNLAFNLQQPILVSPILGAALYVSLVDCVLISALKKTEDGTVESTARHAAEILKSKGRKVAANGKILTDDLEILDYFKIKGAEFETSRCRLFRALEIASKGE